MDISPLDLINVEECASRVIGLAQFRQKLAKYLVDKMKAVAPNLGALIGEQVRWFAYQGLWITLSYTVVDISFSLFPPPPKTFLGLGALYCSTNVQILI
jgi:hypothetical protein